MISTGQKNVLLQLDKPSKNIFFKMYIRLIILLYIPTKCAKNIYKSLFKSLIQPKT